MKDYSDIINYKYSGPKNHERMPREMRASQFASFKALNGYEDSIKETGRRVQQRIILSEEKLELLDKNFQEIKLNLKNNPKIKITYFIKDLKKVGGVYQTIITNILKIDNYKKEIILKDKTKILIEDIIEISLIKDE